MEILWVTSGSRGTTKGHEPRELDTGDLNERRPPEMLGVGQSTVEVVVERFSFASEIAFVPHGDLLEGVTIAPLTAPTSEQSPFQAAIFRFAPGGRLARHPATAPEIFAVIEGSGEVIGPDAVGEPISVGEAVFWSAGDEQEMRSAAGMTVLIVQGDQLDRFRQAD